MRRLLVLVILLAIVAADVFADTDVVLLKSPNDGIQPQAVSDKSGTVHLLYYKGDALAGDLFYVRRSRGDDDFSKPIRVNSESGAAIAAGTVRGGQIAVGKNGRVHVAWNGSNKVKGKTGSAMLYSRLDDDGAGFEPQRNLMSRTAVLDGGGSVAADADGNVYVTWHAVSVDGERSEEYRQVWISRSNDEGKTFVEETPAWAKPTGACGCCSMRAYADTAGVLNVVYRGAQNGDNRDIYLLASRDRAQSFDGVLMHPWKIAACPMSTIAIAEGPSGVVAAWETDGQIFFANVKPRLAEYSVPRAVAGRGTARHHPAVAVNRKGEMVIAWTEGTGWQKGGTLAWQVFDSEGEPTTQSDRLKGGIPVWGLPTVVSSADGFLIVH